MPFYFGFNAKVGKTTPTSVSIGEETYEPAEPSKVKLFALVSAYSVITSLWASMISFVVAVLSRKKGTTIAFSEEGAFCGVIKNKLPLRKVGLAFVLKKGLTLDETVYEEMTTLGFSVMMFNKTNLYFKDGASKSDYEWVEENVVGIDESRQVPNRFLTVSAFRSILILANLTSAICKALHQSCIGVADNLKGMGDSILQTTYRKYPREAGLDDEEMEEGEEREEGAATGLKSSEPKPGSSVWVKYLQQLFTYDHADQLGYWMPAAITNPFDTVKEAFIQSGDSTKITSHGLIAKFHPALANPDPNMIGDVLGKYFMRILGEDQEEQHAMLVELKRGVSFLRLTRLGDELSHLYKCIEIAIECRCGMVPFFTGSSYEGSVLMGGEGVVLSWPSQDRIIPFLGVADLKKEFEGISLHTQSLNDIAAMFSEESRDAVKRCSSMRDLRELCKLQKLTTEEMETVTGKASFLSFESDTPWVVSPANIKKAMSIIAGTTPVTGDIPITRHTLFSKDMVLLGLSVFGEKSVPSWNIPAGTFKSLKGSPPKAPNAQNKEYGKTNKQGLVSDVDWTMVVRRTDLKTAVDDFRELVKRGAYRTSTSFLASKAGYLAFDPKRMTEFWTEMQAAYRKTDPNFIPTSGELTVGKDTKKRDRDSTDTAKSRAVKKMRF